MPSSTAKLGTQIIGATNHKNVSSTTITANVSTDELIPGELYNVDATSGNIVITINTAVVGTEYHFFVANLTNSVSFAAGTASIWAPNNTTSIGVVYTHVTVKFVQSGGRAALIPSDPLV